MDCGLSIRISLSTTEMGCTQSSEMEWRERERRERERKKRARAHLPRQNIKGLWDGPFVTIPTYGPLADVRPKPTLPPRPTLPLATPQPYPTCRFEGNRTPTCRTRHALRMRQGQCTYCIVCEIQGKTKKTKYYCEDCHLGVCFTPKTNHYALWHSDEFDYIRGYA